MSHASVLIALDPVELKTRNLADAIEWQMKPFDENGTWFRDGSRWDWYVVGGRFTGKLDGYDPATDKQNYKPCWLCQGTGKRMDGMEVANGCNGCRGTGSAREWNNAPHPGDVQLVQNLDLEKLRAAYIQRGQFLYQQAKAEMGKTTVDTLEFHYDVNPAEESEDEYIKRNYTVEPKVALAHCVFLRNRHWHESERMGWFGTHPTECEIKAEADDVEVMVMRCLHKDEETGARIIVWNEPWEIWSQEFWHRFIEPLHPDVTLVTVDYHV